MVSNYLPKFSAVAFLALNVAAQMPSTYETAGMLRFACSQLVVDRVDPLVNQGETYTGHLHQIVGGNSFNINMPIETHDLPKKSTCTSCSFNEDLSNYWTAVLFFKAKNGSYHRVPQIQNQGLTNKGGMDIYYIPNGKTVAFKKGFRMLAGAAGNVDAKAVNVQSICHRCWTTTNENTFIGGVLPCSGTDSVEIPMDTKCKKIRQTIIFPTCWDGVNLDSEDHKSHVAYGTNGRKLDCPASHPVRLPQLMYEIMWDVSAFMDKSIFPADGSNPFTYSMNIGGPAAHGDYMFGWKDDVLQKAMDNNCNYNAACPKGGLTTQPASKYNACNVKQQAPEQVDGWLKALPLGKVAVKAN